MRLVDRLIATWQESASDRMPDGQPLRTAYIDKWRAATIGHLADGRETVVEGSGHFLPLESPDLVADLVSAAEPEALLESAASRGWPLRRLTDAYVRLVLAESGGNVAEAARRLGIARKTLYEHLGSGLPSTLCGPGRRV